VYSMGILSPTPHVRSRSFHEVSAVTAAGTSPVLFEARDSGVAVVTLNRPDRMNARGGGLAGAIHRHMDRAEAVPDVRVVVVTGTAERPARGADMGDLDTIGGADTSDETDVTKPVGERHPHFVTEVRKPVIAEYGISRISPRVVGRSASLDLLLSGRTFYAEEMATLCAPSSLAVMKRQVHEDVLRNVHDASATAEKLMNESMQRPDFIEGITAFFEKRPPNFPPLT
jgi:enoyl-CoA hydratase/carnithine racemase